MLLRHDQHDDDPHRVPRHPSLPRADLDGEVVNGYNRINVLVSCTCFPVEDRRPGYGAAQQRAGSATAVRFNVPVKVKS